MVIFQLTKGIIKKTQLLTWVAYILGDPVEELQEDEDMDVRRLTAKAKTYVKDAIAQIGGEDVGYVSPTLHFQILKLIYMKC